MIMISLLPTLRLPWQHKPTKPPRWTAPTHQRPLLRHIRKCWGCGRVGVTFCPVECRPYIGKASIPAWQPAVIHVDATEEAADARAAAALDAEVTV